jgi:cell division initiation protein
MKYFPKEIAAKIFDRKMMGFDPEQVEDYLVAIAAQTEALLQENTYLKSTLKEKELDLLYHKDKEQLLQQTMTQATQTTEKMREEAERDGKLIVNEAHQKAEIIVKEAKDSLRKMYQEISELKKSKMQFEANLKAMAQAHLSLLDQGETFMPKMRLPNLDLE